MFSYYFTIALMGFDLSGSPVSADTNRDGRTSMLEAFLYAKGKDTANEVPQLEDNGDGLSTNSPSAAPGKDGALANTFFLQ